MTVKITTPEPEFDWIQLSRDMTPEQETFLQKAWRKTASNPLVPIGAFGATGALMYGLYSMARNDQKMSQMMMRVRIGAQAFAIAAMIGCLIYAGPDQISTSKKPEQ